MFIPRWGEGRGILPPSSSPKITILAWLKQCLDRRIHSKTDSQFALILVAIKKLSLNVFLLNLFPFSSLSYLTFPCPAQSDTETETRRRALEPLHESISPGERVSILLLLKSPKTDLIIIQSITSLDSTKPYAVRRCCIGLKQNSTPSNILHELLKPWLNVHARVQHFLDSCRKLPIMFRFGSRHGPSTTRTKVGWKVWLITDLIKLSKKALTQLGEVPVCWAGGREFKPRPDQHSWFLDNWEERAAFVITSANG